jgi:hypothetical protein
VAAAGALDIALTKRGGEKILGDDIATRVYRIMPQRDIC